MTTERLTQHRQGGDMDAQLENVLEAYAAAEPGPSRTTLTAWIREYPQFARELTDFTAHWQLLEWAGDPLDAEAPRTSFDVAGDEEERLILRGMSVAQSVFYSKRALHPAAQVREAGAAAPGPARQVAPQAMPQAAPEAKPQAARSGARIDSLIAAATRVGLTYAALKERVGLSDSLLKKLNRRLIDPLTIPVRVVADLAAALQQQDEAVATYLALAPRFIVGAQHRASQAPTLPRAREDFFDAVRKDAALPAARKQELLGLPRPYVGDTSREG